MTDEKVRTRVRGLPDAFIERRRKVGHLCDRSRRTTNNQSDHRKEHDVQAAL